jgi:hypothetical protein
MEAIEQKDDDSLELSPVSIDRAQNFSKRVESSQISPNRKNFKVIELLTSQDNHPSSVRAPAASPRSVIKMRGQVIPVDSSLNSGEHQNYTQNEEFKNSAQRESLKDYTEQNFFKLPADRSKAGN